jgi:hypothetical protein
VAYQIKELGVGEILDQAVQIVKNHFGLLFGIVAVAYLPTTFFINYLTPSFPLNFSSEGFEAWGRATQEMQKYTLPLSLLLGYIVAPVTNAAIVWAVANLYLGEPISIVGAFKRAMKMIFPLFVTTLLLGLVLGLGALACIVPYFIFLFWFYFCNYVVIIEGIWGPKALSRSKEIVSGSFGTIFVLGFMTFILQMMIAGGTFFFGGHILTAAINSAVSSCLTIFFIAVGVVVYFSCRCKTEHFDLKMLADAVAQEES